MTARPGRGGGGRARAGVAGRVGGTRLAASSRMTTRRILPQASVAEVLDRVLDRGIVIDAWLRVSVAGIALIEVDARIVVASISTYVREADALAQAPRASRLVAAPESLPAPRRARRPRVTLRCEQGCTFIRAAARRPAKVRCPSGPALVCPVTALSRAA